MEEKIVNKIIPLNTIIEVANYLEDMTEEYNRKFQIDARKNEGVKFTEQVHEFKGEKASVDYLIRFKDGKEIKKSDYNWFVGMLNNLSIIKGISIFSTIKYHAVDRKSGRDTQFMHLYTFVHFSEEMASSKVEGKNMEEETYRVHSYIKGMIENNEDRYNKTVKNRKLRIQSLSFSIGFILSYIIYFILLANKNNFSISLASYLDNKMILVFGQWFIFAIIGNIFGLPIMMALYKNILPKAKFSHYSRNVHRNVYVDNIENYISNNEVQIGKFANNGKNREIIEKIYKVTSKIVLVQLAISIILFLILK